MDKEIAFYWPRKNEILIYSGLDTAYEYWQSDLLNYVDLDAVFSEFVLLGEV